MKRFYSLPGEPGRELLELIGSLTFGDTLTVASTDAFGTGMTRAAFLQAILLRGIKLRANLILPEHLEEWDQHQCAARQQRYERAKERGAYADCGRPKSIDRDPIKKLFDQGFNGAQISRRLDLPKGSVYRIIE